MKGDYYFEFSVTSFQYKDIVTTALLPVMTDTCPASRHVVFYFCSKLFRSKVRFGVVIQYYHVLQHI